MGSHSKWYFIRESQKNGIFLLPIDRNRFFQPFNIFFTLDDISKLPFIIIPLIFSGAKHLHDTAFVFCTGLLDIRKQAMGVTIDICVHLVPQLIQKMGPFDGFFTAFILFVIRRHSAFHHMRGINPGTPFNCPEQMFKFIYKAIRNLAIAYSRRLPKIFQRRIAPNPLAVF